MPHYNVMGIAKSALETSVKYLACDLGKKNIRINAISAGPMKTLAGAAISGARHVFRFSEKVFIYGPRVTCRSGCGRGRDKRAEVRALRYRIDMDAHLRDIEVNLRRKI